VSGGSWQQTASVSVSSGSTVNLGPQPTSGGSWSWSGPNGFSSTSREIDSIPLSSGTNTFTATYTNSCGSTSTQTFTITVSGSATATPTATRTATATATATPCQNCGTNGRVLVGYWHDWETPVWIQLRNVPTSWDIIVVAFANYNGSGNFSFTVDPDETQAQFISDVQYLHSIGKKVLISCGGASETPSFASSSDASNFASSVASMISTFGFDGVDIDFEGGGVYLNANDLNINSPTTPSVVYLIQGLQDLHNQVPSAMITVAPIANYMQAGYQYYGPGNGASNWNGAQLPVVQAISGYLSYVWPQYYNEANIEALDGNLYSEGSEDNLVAMSEMLMKGFPCANGAGNFNALSPKQVVIGVPASTSAAPGYLTNSQLDAAFTYLISGSGQPGSYVLRNSSGYPDTAGFMAWSINWDVYSNGGALATGMSSYLAGLPAIN
ncbi:MAG: glycosyl hydrolase family 18 protein, partial [Bryobacteraceae bacterium]